jgi:drug/metabolite transporter (DMT)-like permease
MNRACPVFLWEEVMRKLPIYAILVLLAGSSFGVVSSIMKLAYRSGLTVQEVTDGQYLSAALLLWIIAAVWPRGQRIAGRRQWLYLLVLGTAGAGTSFSYYQALTYLPASLGIVLLFQFAWIVLVIDIVVTRRLPGAEKWVGTLLIVVGTILAVGLLAAKIEKFPAWAIIYGLLSAVFYSITLYVSGYVETRSSPALRSAINVTVSLALILVVFPPNFMNESLHWGNFVWWGLMAALFSQVVPVMLMFMAIPHTGGRMAGVLGSVELPVAVFVAFIVLHEHVTLIRWLGVVLILAGIIVSEWPMKKRVQVE